MKKRTKIIMGVVLVVMILFGGVLAFAGNYFFDFALNRNAPRGISFGSSEDNSDYSGGSEDTKQRWFDQLKTDVELTSLDGLKLHGYTISQPEESHRYMIVCHGYTSKANDMAGFAKGYYDLGFNILAPDARAHGESEGDVRGMGWLERSDILLWINRITEADPKAEIGLFGISMGGATVMMVSGEELPAQVKFIVEDCGYTSVWDEFRVQLKEMFGLPAFPFLDAADIVTRIRGGYSLKEASAADQLAKNTRPILFIHGDADTFVPYSMLDQVYAATEAPKEKLVIAGAAHARSASTDPELYWSTVAQFIEKYME